MSYRQVDVSVVIPTRNRLVSLKRTLISINNQTCLPKEIIIIDSSDKKISYEDIDLFIKKCGIEIYFSEPSVCLQRNIGIQKSLCKYIFLCDDDIEISKNYLENLYKYLEKNKNLKIASGLIYEKRKEKWEYAEEKISFLKLFFCYIFGLSVWVDLKNSDFSKNKIVRKFINYYSSKGNRISKSGWPIVINYQQPCFSSPIYGLGASVINAEKLKKTLFDSAFYENGIGDNYDLAIGLNCEIHIITNSIAYHFKEKSNRINYQKAYFYRAEALHYILLKYKKFTIINLFFFIWSIIGKTILFVVKCKIDLVFYNLKIITRVILNKNIYKKY